MQKKYIYGIILLILLLLVIIFSFLNFTPTDSNKITGGANVTEEINENVKSFEKIRSEGIYLESKKIDIDNKEINPLIYDSVEEFIYYLNPEITDNIKVDLNNEDFYINIIDIEGKNTVTKFDNKLIELIDTNNDKNYKNEAIIDIYKSYKKGSLLGESNNNRSGVRFLKEHELSEFAQMHNNILSPFDGKTFLNIKKELIKKVNKTVDDKKMLGYIYDFEGDFKKAENIKKDVYESKIKYTISGTVSDTYGKKIKGAKIILLNDQKIFSLTNDNGEYEMTFDTYPGSRLRYRAYFSNNYSDGFKSSYVIYNSDNQISKNIDFNLHKSDTKKIIKKEELLNGQKIVVESSKGNTFEFKEGVLVDKNKIKFNGDFVVSIFEFNEFTSSMESFLENDNFDSVIGYTGNRMLTAGMTYMMVTDLEGNELSISKVNPIKTTQITNLKLMMDDFYGIGYKLTNEELDIIIEESKGPGYPIDNEFLSKLKIFGFSPWWVFNKDRGIRENQGFKMINKSGLKESLYYNVD